MSSSKAEVGAKGVKTMVGTGGFGFGGDADGGLGGGAGGGGGGDGQYRDNNGILVNGGG